MAPEPILVGHFAPSDFKVLSQRLEGTGVKFEVVCDTSAPAVNDQGFFSERDTIAVLVRSKEAAVSAAAVVDEWRLEVGHMKRKDI
jgi:hypothetical protein